MRDPNTLLRETAAGVTDAIRYVSASPRRLGETTGIALLFFLFMLLATFPTYSWEMLAAGPQYWIETLASLWWLLIESEGYIGATTIILYAATGGLSMRIVAARTRQFSQSGWQGLAAMVPGTVAVGCAGCGAGLLGLVAGTGALAVLPFAGPLTRGIGIVLFAYFLGREGNPDACAVPSE